MMDGNPLVVLLVEDDDDHAELVRRNLEGQPVASRIVRVSDGAQALDYLQQQGDFADPEQSRAPHLVLLDLRLPKVDGLEVLARIKSSDPLRTIPVVILTTSDAEQDVVRAGRLHANAYVVKPASYAEFVDLMRDLGAFWLAWNQAAESAEPSPGP